MLDPSFSHKISPLRLFALRFVMVRQWWKCWTGGGQHVVHGDHCCGGGWPVCWMLLFFSVTLWTLSGYMCLGVL